ncbi:monooxygenase [Penicillium malachiteum]|nr:monooxygenase [Penicillium malachiteum]
MDRTKQPIHAERHFRIVCVGAGLAGLCFAYKLQRSFQNFELLILEKNESIGGVWFENRYPGVACDVPGHNFAFSFEPAVDCTAEYSSGSEVQQYLKNFSKKHDLEKYCRFNAKVTSASWANDAGCWKVKYQDLASDHSHVQDTEVDADIFLNASGPLNQWKWPSIPGLSDYQGELVHTANWKEDLSLDGKRVALIGNGSSGQQVLPVVQPQVSKLLHFIRQPNWITGPFGAPARSYSQEEIRGFQEITGKLLMKRKKLETVINSSFTSFLSGSPLQSGAQAALTQSMGNIIKDNGLKQDLIPTFATGCRRPTPGIGYLEALCQPNTEVIMGEIERITQVGLIDQTGLEHQTDVIICATGFNTSFLPSFTVTGLEGQTIHDLWADDVTDSYFATTVPSMPNYVVFAGPFSPMVSGSYIRNIEVQADYILQLVDRYQTENIHYFTPRLSISRDFTSHCREFLERTVWKDHCRSHYKADSSNTRLSMWPGSSLHFSDALRELRAEDYDWVYSGSDRFQWLGNGFSAIGMDPMSDLSWYVMEKDEGPLMSRGARRKLLTRTCVQENGEGPNLKSEMRMAD